MRINILVLVPMVVVWVMGNDLDDCDEWEATECYQESGANKCCGPRMDTYVKCIYDNPDNDYGDWEYFECPHGDICVQLEKDPVMVEVCHTDYK